MHEKYTKQVITETLEKNYMPYAMSVIISRAIPEIDGFKPSHRKLLYTMYKMGLISGNKTKSSNVIGQTMKLNPHGDMAIYETLVRLTRGNDALLHPYIDSKGNFGKQFSRDMAFAAPRYTEVKLDGICQEIFKDIDKDTVDFVDNYDGTTKEPLLLPTTYPNIIVNSNQGIAVGMASNICSFNLKEVCEATIRFIDDDNVDLTKYLKAPDFSTGGQLIYNEKNIFDIYETGRGSFKIRAKYKFDKKCNCIEIFEIPYTTTAEAIIDTIADLVKTGKFKEIQDVRDETDLRGLKITIDIRKNTDADGLMNKLFKFTTLEDTFSCNFNILIDGKPNVMSIKSILNEWLLFRSDCIKRQIAFDIVKKEDKLHLLLGLEKILLDIDKAIKIVRGTENDSAVISNLMKGFDIDKIQADYIAEIKLRNLNKQYILDRISEIAKLKEEIKELKEILNSEQKVKNIIIKQLKEISQKHGTERRTEIIGEDSVEIITQEEMIDDYNLKIFLTSQNYFKKIPLTSLRANPEQKLKEGDEIVQEIESHNKAEILFFSNKNNVYKSRIYEIDECKAVSLGHYLTNLLELDEGESIIYIVTTDNYNGYMLFSFEDGRVVKITFSSYETKTKRKKLANAYSAHSRLIYLKHITEDEDFVSTSNINKLLVFNSSMIMEKSTRTSQGTLVLKAKRGSFMEKVIELSLSQIKNVNYYRTKNIPAIGHYIKDEDKGEKLTQMDLY